MKSIFIFLFPLISLIFFTPESSNSIIGEHFPCLLGSTAVERAASRLQETGCKCRTYQLCSCEG